MGGLGGRVRSWGTVSYFLRQRRWVALLICMLVAVLFWLMSAMDGTYTKRVQLQVSEDINLPVGYTLVDSSLIPKVVAVDITAQGGTLLSYSLETIFDKQLHLKLEVDSDFINPQGGRWVVGGLRLRERVLATLPKLSKFVANQSGSDLELRIYPEEITIEYERLTTRSIPVAFTSQIDFGDNAHFILNALTMTPDVVKVYGVRADVDSLLIRDEVIETDDMPIRVDRAGVSSYKVALQVPKGMTLDPDSVEVTVAVEELLYHTEQVSQIEVDNLDKGYTLRLFPSTISVSYLAPRDSLLDLKEDSHPVVLYVDAKEIESQTLQLEVHLREVPRFAHTIQLEPDRVEFILEEKNPEEEKGK
ncbi:MAG: hypothetical protein Q4D93_03015 [Porphyromonas sp.]|nr:hypothetical protein [Porphyromonas sp.]